MQLPDFIVRMLGHADKAEANFIATAALANANAKIATLEAEIVTLKAASSDFTVQIGALTENVSTAQAALATKDTELKNVQAELATAKGTANAVIASQGLAADKLPPLEPRADGSADPKTLTLTERCLAANAKTNGNGAAHN
jgi:hypothetical protein